jgi:hypothetical protein
MIFPYSSCASPSNLVNYAKSHDDFPDIKSHISLKCVSKLNNKNIIILNHTLMRIENAFS